MPSPSSVVEIMSSSVTLFAERKELSPDSHFRWSSMVKFIYTACTYSTSVYNFDLFSKVVNKVRIFEFVFCEITIGMAYMFMDCFIKQYTRKLDAYKYLNPLLKGITYGLFLQTALWSLLHASYVADSLRFLVSSLHEAPAWSTCRKSSDISCVSSKDIISQCQQYQPVTNFTTTSAHFNYIKAFKRLDRNVLMTRFFVIGLVWMCNFFFSTVTDDTLLKIFKLSFICGTISSVVIILLLLITTKYHAITAFIQLLDTNSEHYYTESMEHVTYTYGIGFLGFFDFSPMSHRTMIDNAVIIFMLIFTSVAFLRSWIVRVLYVMLTKCVAVEISFSPHYFFFAILPLSTQFLHAHKLYTFYIYINMVVSTTTYLMMLTLTMSKLLNTEFRSVKNIYIVGLLCCLGFGFSLPISVSLTTGPRALGLVAGLDICVLYLGGFKVAIIMWVYGVKKFSTDIHFWLGFKPTKFWKLSWCLLPIILSGFLFTKIYMLTLSTDRRFIIPAILWISLSIFIVTIFHIKTIAKYLVRNNLAAVFSSSLKYGPPDPDDRKKRRHFNETIHLRQCQHNCHILDDTFDCNHLPLMQTHSSKISLVGEPSVKDIFREGPTSRIRTSIALDINSSNQ